MSKPDDDSLDLLFQLLQELSTLDAMSQFLQGRGLHYSASSWEQMVESRLKPELREEKISFDDLIGLLRDAEEFGKQHVFLFQAKKKSLVAEITNRARVQKILKERNLEEILKRPRLIFLPESPQVVDVRWESDGPRDGLVLKLVEQRIRKRRLSERETKDRLYVEYALEKTRAVKVARLHADGLLELRIFSHKSGSRYAEDLNQFTKQCAFLLPLNQFVPVDLTRAKEALWRDRTALSAEVRFSDSTFRNSTGTILTAATGTIQQNLYDDAGAGESVDVFARHEAYCDRANVWFREGANGIPASDVHVLLSGVSNEFALTANCKRADYEHVLHRIRQLNRKVFPRRKS